MQAEGEFRRVLVASELSAGGDRALGRALALRWRREGVVALLHAAAREPEEARSRLVAQAAGVAGGGPRVEPRIVAGAPLEAIPAEADRVGAELVVLGEEGRARLGVRGTLASRLARRLDAPLLVARRPPGPYRRVVVGVALEGGDGPLVDLALRVAETDAPVELLHAWRLDFEGLLQAEGEDPERFGGPARARAAAALDALAQPYRRRGLPVRTRLEHGGVAAVLVNAARDADLLVLGTNAGSDLSALLLGEQGERVLGAVGCDVLLARLS